MRPSCPLPIPPLSDTPPRRPKTLALCFLLALILLQVGNGNARDAASSPSLPLTDDLPLEGLIAAVETSLEIMARRDGETSYTLCGNDYTLGQLRRGLQAFLAAARRAGTGQELADYVENNFTLCRSAGDRWPGMAFLTGYYEPELTGNLEKDQRFRHPLYSPPPDLVKRHGREGRLKDGEVVPYWSRAEIENQNLLAGHELVYLDDPLAAFVLHIQGSGRIRLPDGSVRPIQYAARSGREYCSIGRLLVKEGRLTLEQADMPGIISYLRRHPEEISRVLHHNESYIFFRWGRQNEPGPLGSFGLPLTPGRSLALDQNYYPPGIPAYLAGTRAEINENQELAGWRSFGRFVFNQDSGSAIRGRGRADLFWGGDPGAALAAGVTRHPAELFLLLPEIGKP